MAKTEKDLFNTLEQESKKNYEEKNKGSNQEAEGGNNDPNEGDNKEAGKETDKETEKGAREQSKNSGQQEPESGTQKQGDDQKQTTQEGGQQGQQGAEAGGQNQDIDLSQIEESKLVDHLKKKTGVEISSLEDVKKIGEKPEPQEQFVSDEIKAINDFVKETNRNPQEYFEANKDWDKVAQEKPQDLAKQYLQEQYPDLDGADIQAELEDKYLPLEELNPDDHEESEVNKRKRENKKRQIELKKLVNKGKDHFNQLKDKYKAPVKTQEQIEQEKVLASDQEFGENMKKVLDNDIQELKFETDQGEFSHQIDDKESLKQNLTSLQSVMDMFRDDSKKFNYKEFAETLIKGMKANDIVKNVSTNSASKAKEETLNEINPSRQGNPPDRSQGQNENKTEAQKQTEQNLDKMLGKFGKRKIK